MHQGQVAFLSGAIFKLLGDAPMRGVGLGGHHDARGPAIKAMHHARTRELLTNFAQRSLRAMQKMPSQRVDERAALVTARRMHQQSRLLVDHDQIMVFKNNVKRNVVGRNFA